MEESKDHLKIDLEFLDKKEPLRVAPKPDSQTRQTSTPNSVSTSHQYNWKKILVTGAIILFFGWAIFSDSSSSSSTSNDFLAGTGQNFSCSGSNHDRALALRPNATTAASLASESDALDRRISAAKIQNAEIDAMYVDETDQSSIDRYNAAVNDYNNKNNRLQLDTDSWNQRNAALNSQIDAYNNFLDTNCTPE